MVKRTEIINRDLTTDITLFAADAINQNGWTPKSGGFWNEFASGIRSVGFIVADAEYKTPGINISPSIFEFETNIYISWGSATAGSNLVTRIWVGDTSYTYYINCIIQIVEQHVTYGDYLRLTILEYVNGTSTYSYDVRIDPDNLLNNAWNGIKFRIERGNFGKVFIDPGNFGFWRNIPNNQGADLQTIEIQPSGVRTYTIARFQIWHSHISQDVAISDFSLYNITSLLISSTAGMLDEDGNQILGVDITDDGSGGSTGGKDGFGGGGITTVTLTFQAGGYVNAVDADIGLAVLGGTSGDTGTLVSYDNTAREWVISPTDSDDIFDVSEVVAVTLGTGTGTTTGAATVVTIVGGIIEGGNGIPGSGSEGNIDYSIYKSNIGTGDATGWRDSGSGISIVNWNFTRELDGFGFCDVELSVVNNWSQILSSFIGKNVALTQDGVIIFRGYVVEPHLPYRYEGVLTLKERHHKLNEFETNLNYSLIITTLGTFYAKITVVNTTTITIENPSISGIAKDGSHAVLIIPGDDPAFSLEDFNNLVSGQGTISDVNTDDENYVNSHVSSSLIESFVELEGVYSGTRSSITALVIKGKTDVKELFQGNVIRLYAWDYTLGTPAYVEIDSQNISGSYLPIGRVAFEWETSITSSPQNYVNTADNKFKIKFAVDERGAFENIKVKFLDLVVYTDPFYTGDKFVISNTDVAAGTITSTTNFATAGVNVGDTIIIGTKNTIVLAALAGEFFHDMTIDVDSTFTGYTASNFAKDHLSSINAIRSVLKKDQGLMYYDSNLDTLFFKKKSNLTETGITLSNSSFKSGIQTHIVEAQTKQQDAYRRYEVTGNNYKIFDNDEKPVFAASDNTGLLTNRVGRLTDTSLNSVTECQDRADSEKALSEQSSKVFSVDYDDNDEIELAKLFPGQLFKIQYHGTLHDGDDGRGLPLNQVAVTRLGKKLSIQMTFGWKATSYEDRKTDEINDLRTEISMLKSAMGIRSTGQLKGLIASHRHGHDFFNGSFTESFDATTSSNGTVVTMSLEKSGTGDLTMRFSDGETILDCTPACTIELTVGSDASAQSNYIYIPQSTKVLTKSTSSWPSAEHIKVGYFVVPSAVFVQNNGCYGNQNINSEAMDTVSQGHQSHQDNRSRLFGARYFSGIDGNGTDGYLTATASNVEFISTSGIIYQMYKHTFPAVSTVSGDVVLVKNWSGDAYHDITNLFDIVADSTGTTIGNNKYFNLIVWGIGNKTGEYETVVINLPGGFYSSASGAQADSNQYDDYDIPREFSIDSSTGFLICRIRIKMATTWVIQGTDDLRGRSPLSAGGGAASSVVEFSDNTFKIYDETDNTKELQFQVSGITTATTRTKTVQDTTGTLAELTDIPVASDFNHNDLSNIDAGDINHLTDAQVAALHAIYVLTKAAVDGVAASHDSLSDVSTSDHHVKYAISDDLLDEDDMATDSATKPASQQSIKAYIDAINMIGSANATWIPTIGTQAGDFSKLDELRDSAGFYATAGTYDTTMTYRLLLPTNKGGLSLFVSGLRVQIYAADADDYVNFFKLYGTDYNTQTLLTGFSDTTPRTAQGVYTITPTAVDVSSYSVIAAYLDLKTTTSNQLLISSVEVLCYYA